MNRKFSTVALLTSFLALLIHGCDRQNSVDSNTAAQANSEGKIQFICDRRFDKTSDRYLFSTLAWNDKAKKAIIVWQQEDFSGNGYPPQARCEEVSPRFQAAYDSGNLKFITHGRMNRQPVICTASKVGGDCETLLITLKHQDNAEKTLEQLSDILLGYASAPLQQSSGDIAYDNNNKPYVEVDIAEFLTKS